MDLKVYPDERRLQKGETQRLLVTAIFSDGQVRDVTADAAYYTPDPKIASVIQGGGEGGRTRAMRRSW